MDRPTRPNCPSTAISPLCATQDDYFNVRLDDPTDYGPDRPNLETPEGVDWAALLEAIEGARETLAGGPEGTGVGLVVVEGFLLLASAEGGGSALPLFDAVFFLDCPAEECLRRRLARNPDRSAEQAAGLRGYWERCTWPGYLDFTAPVFEGMKEGRDERLSVIDATATQEGAEAALLAAAGSHPRLATLRSAAGGKL